MRNFAILSLSLLLLLFTQYNAQFWKSNNELTERDIFILETKSRMPSGICYREVKGKANDPALRTYLHSHCCNGYQKNASSSGLQCDPICTEDCLNGICTEPDVCECFPGFTRSGGRCEEY